MSSSTLVRGLLVLEEVARGGPDGVGVTEISEVLSLDKSTASRVLSTLRGAGYVRQDARRRYHVTSKLARIASEQRGSMEIKEVCAKAVRWIQAQFDEEVHIAVPNGSEMIFIDYSPSSQTVRSVLPTVPLPIHRSAVGVAVLAALDHSERADLLSGDARLVGDPMSRADWEAVGAEVGRARERGWATYDAGDDTTRVAVAFTDAGGHPLGSICLSGPSYRMDPVVPAAAGVVMQAAAEIGHALTDGRPVDL